MNHGPVNNAQRHVPGIHAPQHTDPFGDIVYPFDPNAANQTTVRAGGVVGEDVNYGRGEYGQGEPPSPAKGVGRIGVVGAIEQPARATQRGRFSADEEDADRAARALAPPTEDPDFYSSEPRTNLHNPHNPDVPTWKRRRQ